MNKPVRLRKENGKLVHHVSADEIAFQLWKRSLDEGQQVEAYFDVVSNARSLGQLNKVHKLIHQIVSETGNDVLTVKKEIKRISGLYYPSLDGSIQYRSFADCSRDELSRAIFVAEEIGIGIGIPAY